MPNSDDDDIELADAIEMLHEQFSRAVLRAAGKDVQFPVESLTVELNAVAKQTRDGKAGFKIPLVNVEVGGGIGRSGESTQKVTVVFSAPLDTQGNPIKVAGRSTREKG